LFSIDLTTLYFEAADEDDLRKTDFSKNGKIRKHTKNKLSLPTDDAVKKSVYLAITQVTKRWAQPIRNWGIILNQFTTIFEGKIKP
jgi:transposase-like protein